ncbi:MAG: VIT1/CCC1 transporter family protein [Cyanobacteria bacterium REEB65]|nr:VIT1/CCC1 transporter family protein [Cyanobacteria bacterium REEB65]
MPQAENPEPGRGVPPGHPEHPLPHWRPAPGFWKGLSPRQLTGAEATALESRLRRTSGNAVRAAVLGVNDGLVTNLCLISGVLGAALPGRAVLLTGLAGLLAGAFSMALGEWLSVKSAREVHERLLELEAQQIVQFPEDERRELIQIYQAKGLDRQEAESLAAKLMADRSAVLDTMAREEFGLNPEDLGGSPWQAAAVSFGGFATGAIVPMLSFCWLKSPQAVVTGLVLSLLALFGSGVATSLLTGRNPVFAGARQTIIGIMAAAATYAILHLFHTSVLPA